jgi:single-strand DNA-binding protein
VQSARNGEGLQSFFQSVAKEILMSSISKVTGSIIGYLGTEPRITRVGEQATARTFYCVIRNLHWRDADSGERQDKRVVLPLVSWGRQAERDAQYLHKGAHVAVEFRIDNVKYEQDGENVFDFQFTVEAIEYLDSKAQREARQAGKASGDVSASSTAQA